jgi:DNA-directed RNA polymerase subunit M/transcription elongation factor TFIIS
MSFDREKGIEALSTVLQQVKNCQMFEKYIFDYVSAKSEKDNEDEISAENALLYNWYIYQVIGLLIQDMANMKKIYKSIKEGKVGWKSSTYDDVTNKFEEHDEYLVKPFEVVEGVAQCGKCGSKKTWSIAKQLRGGDEGTSTISRCVECGHHWVYGG